MGLKVGRVDLSTPLDVIPTRKRRVDDMDGAGGIAIPTHRQSYPTSYEVVGRETYRANKRMDDLEKEAGRLGSVRVESSDAIDGFDLLEKGYYELRDARAPKERGKPKFRRWELSLVKQPDPDILFEAEDHDARNIGSTADADASDEKKVVYTPTTTFTPVLQIGSSLSLLLRLESNATDLSGLGNNGTVTGPLFVAGRIGNGADFDGVNDYIQVPDHASLKPKKEITVEFWMRPAAGEVPPTADRVLCHKLNSFRAKQVNSGMEFIVTIGGSNKQVTVSSGLAASTWAHIIGTYDGANVKLYLDGVEKAALAATGDLNTNTNALFIGASSAAAEFYKGTLDEFRVYRRALTADEVKKRYDDTKNGTRPANDYRAPLDAGLDLPAGSWKIMARVNSRTTFTQQVRSRLLDKNGANIDLESGVAATAADEWQYLVSKAGFAIPTANVGENFLILEANAVVGQLNDVWFDLAEIVKV